MRSARSVWNCPAVLHVLDLVCVTRSRPSNYPTAFREIQVGERPDAIKKNPGQSTHPGSGEFSRLGFCAERQGDVGGDGACRSARPNGKQ